MMKAVTDANPTSLQYVLVTPARNEVAFIERTLQSVVVQTVRPLRWVVVSDGSTDGTDEVVERYSRQYPWIELVRRPARKDRHFAGKVHAFNAGYERVRDLQYDLIGNLDADVSFEPDYFDYLLSQFRTNPRLGVAGTNYFETSLRYDYRYSNVQDVPGACQLFRRECFEAIGGYRPIEAGGIDLVAVLSARMNGWETMTFADRYLMHHRAQGSATANRWVVHFVDGQHDYRFGGHPVFELFRATYRMGKRPFVIGGCFLLAGYVSSLCRRIERPVSQDLIRFRRKEQISRLVRFCKTAIEKPTKLFTMIISASWEGYYEFVGMMGVLL